MGAAMEATIVATMGAAMQATIVATMRAAVAIVAAMGATSIMVMPTVVPTDGLRAAMDAGKGLSAQPLLAGASTVLAQSQHSCRVANSTPRALPCSRHLTR